MILGLDSKEIVILGNNALEAARLTNEENDCRFEVLRDEHWIYTRFTWSIVRERLLELFCV